MIAGDGAVTPDRGLSQTYTSIRAPYAGVDGNRDTYRQQWAVGIFNYFLTMGLIPATPISFNPAPSQYVNCETGQPEDAGIGFFHDFYSGKLAVPDAPSVCLGIGASAWAWGGTVTHSGSHPVFSALERVDALIEQVDALQGASLLSRQGAMRLRKLLLAEHHVLAMKHSPIGRSGLSLMRKEVQYLVQKGQLLPHAGDLLIEAATSAEACVAR